MAKILKHFGIGGKKHPPHPPKPDYSNGKSSSVQDLCGKYPTCERRSHKHKLSTSSSNIHRSFESGESPRHYHSLKTNGLSRASSDKHRSVGAVGSDLIPPVTSEENLSGGNPTPPRLLDDYSVPYDLKKQIEKNPELGGVLAQAGELKSPDIEEVSDDDYSVPYEIKKLNAEKKRRDQEKVEREKREQETLEQETAVKETVKQTNQDQDTEIQEKKPSEQEEQKQETQNKEGEAAKTEELLPVAETDEKTEIEENSEMPRPPREEPGAAGGMLLPTAADLRPDQEYQPPWDCKTAAAVQYQKQIMQESTLDPEYENTRHDYVNAPIGAMAKPSPNVSGLEKTDANFGGARPKERQNQPPSQRIKQQKGSVSDGRIGTYEEPWDLSSTQNMLEEAFLAKKFQPPPREKISPNKEENAAVGAATPQHYPPDTRPQEGYEKPWDWKPHKKDDREQEGYEKPWDWKPHQKDERPMEEYDTPWEQRAKNIEQNIVKAQSAKENKGCASNVKHNTGSSQCAGVSRMDTRPMDEYDQPWDQKMAAVAAAAAGSRSITRTASDSSPVSQPSPVLHSSPQCSKSPASRHQSYPLQPKVNIDPGWSPKGERIDPKLPLEKQTWYHGAISRVDAERLMRVHKEGSFLVRMSESNKRDFSLSLKSARGFMHMKIVYKSGCFILGQFSSPFESIPKMIHHYSINKLPIKGAEHMSLIHPIINELL